MNTFPVKISYISIYLNVPCVILLHLLDSILQACLMYLSFFSFTKTYFMAH